MLVPRLLVTSLTAMSVVTGCTISHAMRFESRDETCRTIVQPGLTWLGPTETGDVATLDEWCKTVGPPVIDSTPHPSFGAWQARDSVAVVAWNVNAGSGELLALFERELHLECATPTPAARAAFSHFVLLAQEAFRRSATVPSMSPRSTIPPRTSERPRSGSRIDIVETARQCGLAVMYVPSMRNGHDEYDGEREDWGNAILSTLPLSDFIAIELPFEASRRVAVGATIHAPDRDSLRAVSVHLSTFPGAWRVLRTGNSGRVRQANGLVDALRAVERLRSGTAGTACDPPCSSNRSAELSISTIAGGDLNTWSSRETALRHLWEHFPDSPRNDQPTRGPFPTDHLVFRIRAGNTTGLHVVTESYRRIDASYNSDHQPRILWVRAHQ